MHGQIAIKEKWRSGLGKVDNLPISQKIPLHHQNGWFEAVFLDVYHSL